MTPPMFWKSRKGHKTEENKISFGMVMLHDENFDIDSFQNDFKSFDGDNIKECTGDSSSFVFTVDGETVAIAHIDGLIPKPDIEATAQYAYNWGTALEDTKNHKGHLIVSLIQGGQNQIKRFKIFSQVLCSLLRTTNAVGVYKGTQSLLIPKYDYLNEAEAMIVNACH